MALNWHVSMEICGKKILPKIGVNFQGGLGTLTEFNLEREKQRKSPLA